MKTDILYTKRLQLKEIEDKDKDDMLSILTDPKVYKSYMIPDLLTDEEKDKFFNRIKNATLSNDRIAYGIYLNNKIIGFINEVERSRILYFIFILESRICLWGSIYND